MFYHLGVASYTHWLKCLLWHRYMFITDNIVGAIGRPKSVLPSRDSEVSGNKPHLTRKGYTLCLCVCVLYVHVH